MTPMDKVEKVAIPDAAVEAAMHAYFGDGYDGRLIGCAVAVEDDVKQAMRAAIEAALAAMGEREPVATVKGATIGGGINALYGDTQVVQIGVQPQPPVVAISSAYEPVYRYQTPDTRSFSQTTPPASPLPVKEAVKVAQALRLAKELADSCIAERGEDLEADCLVMEAKAAVDKSEGIITGGNYPQVVKTPVTHLGKIAVDTMQSVHTVEDAIRAVERERCARVADAYAEKMRAAQVRQAAKGRTTTVAECKEDAGISIAAAIRAAEEK